MAENVKIVVDAMGGDNAPDVVLEGVAQAIAEDPELNVILCGKGSVVQPFCDAHDRTEAVAAEEVISMGEHPANAVRQKKDSSIVRGCELVRDGDASGFFSAGSTGACLAAATLVVGRIKGIKRPAIVQLLPSYEKPCILLDVGANADCKPEYLVQFATMGAVYAKALFGAEHPKVGLLNIGEEDAKGNALALAAHKCMVESVSGFAGNCEPHDMLQGKFDVVVTDGFTGNIALKTIEGTSKMLFRYIKDALTETAASKLGAVFVKGNLAKLKEKLSPDTFGGSPLLGVKAEVLIGHGSSNSTAIKNGVLATARAVRANVSGLIAGSCSKAPGGDD